MPSTQLACPHCGSMLSFGMEIAAGAPVECLICMRSFTAEPVPCADTTSADPHGATSRPSFEPSAAPTVADTIADVAPTNTAEPATLAMPEPVLSAEPPAPLNATGPTTVSDSPPTVEMTLPAEAKPRKPTRAKTAPHDGVVVAKPYAAPPKAPPVSPSADTKSAGPRLRRAPQNDATNKIVLAAAALGMVLLLSGGIGLAAWKLTHTPRVPPELAESDAALIAAGQKTKKNGLNTGQQASGEEEGQPPLSEEDEEDIRFKLQEEVKQLLKRKIRVKGGGDFDWDSVATFNIAKQNITGLDQKKINQAIIRGVIYLKRSQNADGTWHQGHGVGQAALGGLTLLECGVDRDDPAVKKAVRYVRTNIAKLQATYELSLAILLLDRLGETRDRPLIQGMALRLLAGQNDSGGWTYTCPLLNPQEMYQLFNFLHANKRPDLLNPLGDTVKTPSGIVVNPTRDPSKLNDPFHQLNELVLTKGIASPDPKAKPGAKKEGIIEPVRGDPKKAAPTKPIQAKKTTPIRPEWLKPNLQKLPVVKNQGKRKGQFARSRQGGGDNSNTQFALLAMWTARRHNVPTDHALLAAYHRFLSSQSSQGGWTYQFQPAGSGGMTASMTGVGLLGLAMGHGAAPEFINFNPKNPKDSIVKPALQDPVIQRGLGAFARYIGQPSTDPKNTQFPMQNLYLLWTIERVAMLYDLKTIGGKDWYGWGAQILVHNQDPGGAWTNALYPGASSPTSTCFALLFLRRSNLVRDLTDNLRLYSGIRDGQ